MKRFKLIFHITYVLVTLAVMYFSIDVLMNTEDYLSQIKLSSYIKFPKYVMIAFLSLSVIMIIEFILERVNVYQVKEGIDDMESEIVQLKAKLYDKSQEEREEDDDEEEDLADVAALGDEDDDDED